MWFWDLLGNIIGYSIAAIVGLTFIGILLKMLFVFFENVSKSDVISEEDLEYLKKYSIVKKEEHEKWMEDAMEKRRSGGYRDMHKFEQALGREEENWTNLSEAISKAFECKKWSSARCKDQRLYAFEIRRYGR